MTCLLCRSMHNACRWLHKNFTIHDETVKSNAVEMVTLNLRNVNNKQKRAGKPTLLLVTYQQILHLEYHTLAMIANCSMHSAHFRTMKVGLHQAFHLSSLNLTYNRLMFSIHAHAVVNLP